MKRLKKLGIAAGALTLVIGTAIAGTTITGYGSTRAEAMERADAKARQASYDRFQKYTCFTPAKPSTCRQDSQGWACDAAVANHRGSCD